MNILLITLGTIFSIIIVGTGLFFYIKNAYLKYDIRKSKEEELEILRQSIKSAKDYFRKTYNTDFDDTVWKNIKENTNFLIQLIENRNIDDKIKYYDKLFKMLYETGIRLKTNFDNVQYIMSPLQNLREELVEYQLTYLRNHSDL